MQLKNFPLLMEGMKQIMLDQYRKGAFMKTEQEVPEWWEPRFIIAETGLAKFAGRTVREISPALVELPGYEDMELDTQAIEYFYLPMDDTDVWLADAAGMNIPQFHFARYIFEQFFDGGLREVFQGGG